MGRVVKWCGVEGEGKTYDFENLTANDVFDEVHSSWVRVLNFAEHEHLFHGQVHTTAFRQWHIRNWIGSGKQWHLEESQTHHLRYLLSIPILFDSIILYELVLAHRVRAWVWSVRSGTCPPSVWSSLTSAIGTVCWRVLVLSCTHYSLAAGSQSNVDD